MKNMLVIKQNVMVDSFHEPRPYKTKFWVTKECYKQLLKIAKETKMTVSNIIRMALNYVIFDEAQIEKLKDKEEMSDELVHRKHRSTVNLSEEQANRIAEISNKHGVSRTEIIKRSIEIFLNQVNFRRGDR